VGHFGSVTRQLVFPQRIFRSSDEAAATTLVVDRHVLGFDVTPTVGLVTEVLRAGHARPDAGHLQHVLHQDLRRVWKKWQPGDF
jgi:hypothetical protein